MKRKKILILIACVFVLVFGLSIYAFKIANSRDTEQAKPDTSITADPSEKTPEASGESGQTGEQKNQAETPVSPDPGTDTEEPESENPALTPESGEGEDPSVSNQEKLPEASDEKEQITEKETQEDEPEAREQGTDTEQPETDEGDDPSAGIQEIPPAAGRDEVATAHFLEDKVRCGADEGRSLARWLEGPPCQDRHGLQEHAHARPDPLQDQARPSSPHRRQVVHLPDV